MAKKRSVTVPDGADLSHIVEQLRPLAVPVAALSPDPENARAHDARNVEVIAESFRRFGQDQPLVVQRDGMVVRKGNGRLEAAASLGWKYIAAVVVDEADAEAIERALVDNRSSELAAWDVPVLRRLLDQVTEERGERPAGWTDADVAALAAWVQPADPTPPAGGAAAPPSEFPAYGEDIATEYQCPKCAYKWSGKAK